MSHESIDKIQRVLADTVFAHTKDAKKASGRALGTFVEIVTYYLLKTWGLNDQISIERGLEEYGNADITHNIEFSLHPIIRNAACVLEKNKKTITAGTILKLLEGQQLDLGGLQKTSNQLLNKEVLRNACTIAVAKDSFLLASVTDITGNAVKLNVYEQYRKPYAIFECKRVGVEEGMRKGPQTIEKAKQGAYVARTASSLQKIRNEAGEVYGIMYKSDGTHVIKPFVDLMEEVVHSNDKELLRRFILTVGVVSNHGNWFTAESQSKEMKVLAQSYDWLLFLTDAGLSRFVENLLLKPMSEFRLVREIFLSSYTKDKIKNQFTKVQMNIKADSILLRYFKNNLAAIESWFNVISPKNKTLSVLKKELKELQGKNWKSILQ